MRALLALPFLAACAHAPEPCQWPRTCEERRDAVQAVDAKPQPEPVAERPVDVSPPASKRVDDSNGAETGDNGGKSKDHSRDGNGGSSDGNSDDGNGGKS